MLVNLLGRFFLSNGSPFELLSGKLNMFLKNLKVNFSTSVYGVQIRHWARISEMCLQKHSLNAILEMIENINHLRFLLK